MYTPTETGHWVSQDFAHLAEVIEDYNPVMELRWIPPENRNTPHERKNPWAVFSRNQLVFLCSEKDKPNEILARIVMGDQKWGSTLERMESEDRAQKILDAKEQMEVYGASKEEFQFLVDNANRGKHYLKHNGKKLDGESLKEIPDSRRAYIL